jgi:hypothetical protein
MVIVRKALQHLGESIPDMRPHRGIGDELISAA